MTCRFCLATRLGLRGSDRLLRGTAGFCCLNIGSGSLGRAAFLPFAQRGERTGVAAVPASRSKEALGASDDEVMPQGCEKGRRSMASVGFLTLGLSTAAGGVALGRAIALVSCKWVALASRSWMYLAHR